MRTVLIGSNVFVKDKLIKANVFLNDGIIVDISDSLPIDGDIVFDFNNCFIFPGFTDVHTHLREPGFFYKETVKSGTMAAAAGGYTTICAMPNLNPVPDSLENLRKELDIIKKDALINVYPYGAVTKKEEGQILSDIFDMAPFVCAFSDDGRGIQSEEMMENAMTEIKKTGKILSAHCEDNSLLFGGYIHDGVYAKTHGHKGISSESEFSQIARDLVLAKKIKCKYHVCHISTKESVDLIRNAKKCGIDVTCETAPHYLTLCDEDLKEDGRFKMNPPLRSKSDREALLEGICDGTVDMIATDHAPHSEEEKSKGLEGSLMGITGLECAFPILYTKLVKTNIITLEKLISLLNTNANKRFEIGSSIEIGKKADITVFDLNEKYKIDSSKFNSMGKSTPFDGETVYGRCKMTICGGRIIWKENLTEK